MKKIFLLLMVSTLLIFAACSSEEAAPPAEEPAAEAGAEEPAAEPAAEGETYVIKFGTLGPEAGNAMADGMNYLGELLEEKSGGRFEFETYANSVLGGDTVMMEQMVAGSLQMGDPSFSSLSMYDEKIGIANLPFLFSSPESAIAAGQGAFGEMTKSYLEGTGIIMPGPIYYCEGTILTNNIHPIDEPGDLVDLKLRAQQSIANVAAWEQFGVNPTPMDFGEFFTACQNGTVDGGENWLGLAAPFGYGEVQDYVTDLHQSYSTIGISVSEVWFNELPEDLQAIVVESLEEHAQFMNEHYADYDEEFYAKLIADGAEITYLTDEQRAAFRDIALPYLDEYIEKFGQEIFDLAWEFEV